jgi:hypothetical protein
MTLEEYVKYLENKSPSQCISIPTYEQQYYTHYEGFIKKKFSEGWDIHDLFLYYVKEGKLFYVRKMLNDPRLDPSYCENECIVLSVLHQHYPIFDLLYLDERIDPTTQNNLPYMISVQYSDLYIKQKLENHPKVVQSIQNILRF